MREHLTATEVEAVRREVLAGLVRQQEWVGGFVRQQELVDGFVSRLLGVFERAELVRRCPFPAGSGLGEIWVRSREAR